MENLEDKIEELEKENKKLEIEETEKEIKVLELEDKIEELEKEIKELELENAQLSASLSATAAENEKLKNSLVVLGKAIDMTNDVWRIISGGVEY